MTYLPEPTYDAWRSQKTQLLRLPALACGCSNDGRDVYFHLACPRLACRTHADGPHICRSAAGHPAPFFGVVQAVAREASGDGPFESP